MLKVALNTISPHKITNCGLKHYFNDFVLDKFDMMNSKTICIMTYKRNLSI